MLHGLRFLGSVFMFVGVASAAVPLAPSDAATPSRLRAEDRAFCDVTSSNIPLLIVVSPEVAPLDVPPRDAPPLDALSPLQTCTPAEQCCKICSRGKACSNSCIRQSYACHKGRGCACNAEDVCE